MQQSGGKDYFGSFLSSVEKAGAGLEQSDTAANVQKDLLRLLGQRQDPSSVRTLLDDVRQPVSLVIGALHEMAGANIVTLSQRDGEEFAEITDLGRRIF